MKTFTASVTQFLRPNGKARLAQTELPAEHEAAYIDMHAHGCRFEAEVLTNGLVSMTVSSVKDEMDIDCEISGNGPDVQKGMIAMLKRQRWLPYEIETEDSNEHRTH